LLSKSTTKSRSQAETETEAAEPEVVLRLSGITKRFGPLLANDAVNIELRRGEIIGLLGENGAGKTTLMNILFGHYVADEGTVEVFGKSLPPGEPRAAIAAGIGMVHQHFTLADNLTVYENIVLGTQAFWRFGSNYGSAVRRIESLTKSFGINVDPAATVGRLSVGERQRVEILKALYRNARVLILDEPTAVLTPQESKRLFGTLTSLLAGGLSVIFITHKLYEVMEATRRVYVLRAGRLVAERDTGKTTREELAELMIGRPIPSPQREAQNPGPILAELRNVTVRKKGELLLDGVNLQLRSGEILGIAGVAGNGQRVMADLFAGLLHPDAGSLTIGGASYPRLSPQDAVQLGIGRIPEDRHSQGVIGDMSVTENLLAEQYRAKKFTRFGLIDWEAANRFAAGIIRDYDVRCPSSATSVRLLSGGNMQKLILGRVLSGKPRIVIVSQPSRGLDVGAVAYVHGRLLAACASGAAVLLISEDLDEIIALADRISVAFRGRLSAPIERAAVTVRQLGLKMAGHGFEDVLPREAGNAA
jgi:general nucleoside transport system ATP-binding protein